MRVAVLSDTHAPRFWKTCPAAVARHLEGADAILHGGDVCTPEVLTELAAYAPVYAVLGNNDGPSVAASACVASGAALGVPKQLQLDLGGLAVAMIHDSGPRRGRALRMLKAFPDAALVVFGHSHIPWDSQGDSQGDSTEDSTGDSTGGGQRLFNPGSPTDKRRQPHPTMGELVIDDGRLVEARIIELC